MTDMFGRVTYARCGSCQAQVVWAVDEASSELVPLDRDPVPDGIYIPHRGAVNDRYVHALNAGEAAPPGAPRFVSHYVTCTNRKRGRNGDG